VDKASLADRRHEATRQEERWRAIRERASRGLLSFNAGGVVRLEGAKAKVGGRAEITPITLRATMIFRPEDGEWKMVHRHADPITTARPAASVIQE
jgi:SnoaL-like domain